MADAGARPRTPLPIRPALVVAVFLPAIAAYAALFAYAMWHTSYDIWAAFWLIPALTAISTPILLRFARKNAKLAIGSILVVALVLKLISAIPRYYMVAVMYETGDSFRYSDAGKLLRQDFLHLDFHFTATGEGSQTGTLFVEFITGIIYSVIGPSFLGGFVFFSWLSFWGLFFFFRAFQVGVPDGDTRRYALFLFFLPTMLFWPSSIGKEAWMTLALGIGSYGCSLLLARRPGASIYIILGVAGVLAVRPHMALLLAAGVSLAYVLRASPAQRVVALGRTRTALGLGFLGIGTLLVIRRVSEFFGIDEFNLDTATEQLETAQRNTSTGDSEFVGGGASLTALPMNIVTVLFRPFAFEVDSIPTLLAALEGTALMVLFLLSWPRLRTIPRRLRKQPYVTYSLVYAILFCFIFSVFQNFGILARQRVLVFPLILVLLALPPAASALERSRRRRRSFTAQPIHAAMTPSRE